MSFIETEPLRPQLFVTRQNGTMVPLVAADELPSTISIRGIPRTLSPHDISGMTGVGTFNSRHRQYVIDGLNKRADAPPIPGDRSLMGSSFATPVIGPLRNDVPWQMKRAPVFPTPSKAYGIHEQPPNTPKTPFANMAPHTPEVSAATASADSDLPPFHNLNELPIGRAPGIKEYCSYWLRHGECDYAQQGCLYRHEMPLDRLTLEKLGLRDIPRWYREKHRLGSYLAGGNTMSGISATTSTKPSFMERSWRSHPAEVLLDGTNLESNKEAELPSFPMSSPTQPPNAKPHTSYSPSPKPTATIPKPLISTPKPVISTPKAIASISKTVVSTPKPIYQAILSRHQPSSAPSTKTKMTTSMPEEESISSRQIRETIRMLDAYDQRERDRLSEKFQTLQPQKTGTVVPANTPSPSTASSTSGSAEADGVAEEISTAASQTAPPTRPSSVSHSPLPCPKPASRRPVSVVQKRMGKAKCRNSYRRETGNMAENGERMKVERLVDHD